MYSFKAVYSTNNRKNKLWSFCDPANSCSHTSCAFCEFQDRLDDRKVCHTSQHLPGLSSCQRTLQTNWLTSSTRSTARASKAGSCTRLGGDVCCWKLPAEAAGGAWSEFRWLVPIEKLICDYTDCLVWQNTWLWMFPHKCILHCLRNYGWYSEEFDHPLREYSSKRANFSGKNGRPLEKVSL